MYANIFLMLFFVIFTIKFGNCAKLPSYFKQCNGKSGLSECIKQNIDDNLKNIVDNGDKSMKLSSLNPMKVKHIILQATPSLKVIMEDVEFSGFDTIKMKNVVADLEHKLLTLEFNFGYFHMIGKYNVSGQILILPIVGSGTANITAIDCDNVYTTYIDTIDKDGITYYKAVEKPMNIIPKKILFQLDNLFNGNKRLGDEMNRFLNENWKGVYEEINGGISDIINTLITRVVNAFWTNIPVSELIND